MTKFLYIFSLTSAGETFSENYSVTEKCTDCTQCLGLMRMVAPCTDISDAKCQCDYNFFFNPLSGRCERCTVCPRGRGVYSQCDHYHDTICEDCVDETYSDQDSSVEPCLPCTICEENIETLESDCTPTTDTVCFSKSAARLVTVMLVQVIFFYSNRITQVKIKLFELVSEHD